ncbi:MAG: threonine--tRNA ligase [bacterium]
MAEDVQTKKQIYVLNEKIEVESDATLEDIADDHGPEDAIGAVVNGELRDLRDCPDEGDEIRFVTFEDPEGKKIYWHTTAHILAQAVQYYFDDQGDVKLGVGPPIEDGFYYDFDLPRTISEDELDNLEGIMNQIIQNDLPLERRYADREQAIRELEENQEPFKVELVEELDNQPSFYRQNGFEDLCGGPHLKSTGEVEAVKLTKLSGAYWKGDQDNAELQRIYGISFPSDQQLEEYEKKLEEAKKRDHRKLGQELDLFLIEDDIGPGFVTWRPRGGHIRSTIEDYWKQRHLEEGYEIVYSPHLAREKLWDVSGHLDHYADDMFPALEMDDQRYRVKPMNCPYHMKIFNSDTRSYRDLPYRLAELGTVYRDERSGVLHGLLRVRGFTQDDAHIFCEPDQVEDEIIRIMDTTTDILSTFGFEEYEIVVSTQPDDYVGSDDRWELATDSLTNALDQTEHDYEISPGEGAFYGPKIEVQIRDSLDREWQCSTIQVDFNLPERFDIEYVDNDGDRKRPIMIHRALFGSMERFFGCLVEHYGGAFPPWLAPTPVWILPISDENNDYAEKVDDEFAGAGIQAHIEPSTESLGKRIHMAQSQKIPYTLILGGDEEQTETVEVREYGEEESNSLDLREAVDTVQSAIEERHMIHETL